MDMVSGSKLKLTFEKLPLSSFDIIIKNIHNYLRKTLKYSFQAPSNKMLYSRMNAEADNNYLCHYKLKRFAKI